MHGYNAVQGHMMIQSGHCALSTFSLCGQEMGKGQVGTLITPVPAQSSVQNVKSSVVSVRVKEGDKPLDSSDQSDLSAPPLHALAVCIRSDLATVSSFGLAHFWINECKTSADQ
jgi:hypothetical protein